MRDDGGGGYPFIQHDVWLVWEQFFFKFVYGLAIISYVFRLLRVDGCVSIRNGNGERKIKMEKRNEKNKKYKLKALWICRVIWNGSVSSDEIRIKCIQSRPTSEKWFIPCVRSTICMGSVSPNSPREKKNENKQKKNGQHRRYPYTDNVRRTYGTILWWTNCTAAQFYLHFLWLWIFSFPNVEKHWADSWLNHGALLALQLFYVLHF